MQQLRTNAMRSSPHTGARQGVAATTARFLNERTDPHIAARVHQVATWYGVWMLLDRAHRRSVRKAWRMTYARVKITTSKL